MKCKVRPKSVRVIAGRLAEIHRGWVRLSEESRGDIPSGRYVRLVHGGRKIHCQLRGQLEGIPERDCVEMSEYYRDKLRLAVDEVFELKIKAVGLWGRQRALFDHPDDTVRAAMQLGSFGLILGLIGLLLGVIGALL